MHILDALNEVLRPAFVASVDDPAQPERPIRLVEPKQPSFQVTLLPGKRSRHLLLGFEPDVDHQTHRELFGGRRANEALFPLFKPEHRGLTQLCDYVLFYQHNPAATLQVMLAECKVGEHRGAWRQIQNAEPMVRSLVAWAALHAELDPQELRICALLFVGRLRKSPRLPHWQRHPRGGPPSRWAAAGETWELQHLLQGT